MDDLTKETMERIREQSIKEEGFIKQFPYQKTISNMLAPFITFVDTIKANRGEKVSNHVLMGGVVAMVIQCTDNMDEAVTFCDTLKQIIVDMDKIVSKEE